MCIKHFLLPDAFTWIGLFEGHRYMRDANPHHAKLLVNGYIGVGEHK